jgi:hypothetical protein
MSKKQATKEGIKPIGSSLAKIKSVALWHKSKSSRNKRGKDIPESWVRAPRSEGDIEGGWFTVRGYKEKDHES